MTSKTFWGDKTLCIVTGASQGIGRNFAIEFSKKFASGSAVVLIARSEKGLETAKDDILNSRSDITVIIERQDLSRPDIDTYRGIMKRCTNEKYDSYLLIHNAGSEGNGQLTAKMSDLQEWQSYMNLNLFSVTLLTNAFLDSTPSDSERMILNVTSLAALQPFSGLGYYCIGKAAREMYFKTLAAENPKLRVLIYSPGPVDTEMIVRVIDKLEVDETKDIFVSMKEKSTLLTLSQTTDRLIGILEKNAFSSGDRIDYFDEL